MKKLLLNSILAAVAVMFGVACTPESADEHPNHREVVEEPEVDPEINTDELGTLAILLADYQQAGIKIKSIDVSGNNGEEINGTAVDGASGVYVSSGAAGNIVVSYSTPVDITWKPSSTPWTGANLVGAKAFAFQMTAGQYDKGITLKIKDDKDRIFKLVYDKLVVVETEETDTLATLPLAVYYGDVNCVRTAPAVGTVEVDVTPHFSTSASFLPTGGEMLASDGTALVEAKAASVVWQLGQTGDDSAVIGTPTLSGNTLKVPTTGKKGNAVVAIKNSTGDIIWSYHIWVSDAEEVDCSFPDKYGSFKMLDRNLGAISTEPKNQDSYGLFYEWGRKDAFMRPHNIERGAARADVVAFTGCEHELTDETKGTIAYSIKNPGVRLKSTSSLKDWHFAARMQPLWGNINAASSPARASVKTIYDPCPVGYQIPEKEAFGSFTQNDTDMFEANYGFYYPTGVGDKTIFFPANGTIQHTTDNLMYHEYEGFCWSNNPGAGGVYIFRLGLYGSSYRSAVSTLDRAYGAAVRCIKLD